MIIKASERLALVLAAGLLLASPVQAATDGDESASDSKSDSVAAPVTHRTFGQASHHRRHYVHHRVHAIAMKSDTDKKAADAAPDDTKVLPTIPPSVADANAQMLFANAQMNAAAAIPVGSNVSPAQAFDTQASDNHANTSTNNGTFMVAADQLNDSDRTLQEGSSTPAAAASSPPAPATAITGESTALDQTSLIGKIFIGFGALLTMASAARMFFT